MRKIGSVIVIVFPITVAGFALAPPKVLFLSGIAASYGAANGIITIVRGFMVPEMLSRDAYGALVAPMNVTLAVAPLTRPGYGLQQAVTMPYWSPSALALRFCA
ncbi:hypothetical protein [Manganibacter manganicus]|uniref:hypothetical protein n=1 Tax=Manganibacter manganicus TaxID=1873176 RepID=UPI0011182873|nr:hypothetical protein [Pseudaminobacter manganicus]